MTLDHEIREVVLSMNEHNPFMATNTNKGSRQGAVKNRVQVKNPLTGRYVKLDTRTGRIVDHKKTEGPYKGVRVK